MDLSGVLDADRVRDMYKELDDKFCGGTTKVKIIMDISQLQKVPPKIREIFRTTAGNLPVAKLAIVGASMKLRIMAGLILKMLSNVDSSIFTATKEEAMVWLDKD